MDGWSGIAKGGAAAPLEKVCENWLCFSLLPLSVCTMFSKLDNLDKLVNNKQTLTETNLL